MYPAKQLDQAVQIAPSGANLDKWLDQHANGVEYDVIDYDSGDETGKVITLSLADAVAYESGTLAGYKWPDGTVDIEGEDGWVTNAYLVIKGR